MSIAERWPPISKRHAAGNAWLVCVLALSACAPHPQVDLGSALSNIDKSRFLMCSGPPSLEIPEGNLDRMWFTTNLNRGQAIGALSPAADPVESCLVAAVFENSRLTSATFSGNQSMCQVVFGPCLPK